MPPVVFFMLDGVRPDALALARCPQLQALLKRGSFTLERRQRDALPDVALSHLHFL